MKKVKIKKFLIFLIMIILFFSLFSNVVFADVGSFEDYSGGSSWDSGGSWDSSWDSGDSWSSWDSGSSYSGDSGGSLFDVFDLVGVFLFSGPSGIIIIIAILVIVVIAKRGRRGFRRNYNGEVYYGRTRRNESNDLQAMHKLDVRQLQIENKVQEGDPDFNKEEFIAWSKNLFIKLQQAWTARDWETIRTFETPTLFEQHKNQLQGYINNNQINVMDRICVNYAHLYDYRQEGDKETLTVRLNSRMTDYIIDASTKEVLKGDKDKELVNTYLLVFIRKKGVKTKAGTTEINTTNCPNCGAPTQITSAGRCEYCGSVITTGEYNWVLSNLERERIRY